MIISNIKIFSIMNDDAFFHPDWAGACWGRLAGTRAAVGLVRKLWIVGPEIGSLLG